MKTLAFLLFISVYTYAQPPGRGRPDDVPCPPNNPHCGNTVPIGYEWIPVTVALSLGAFSHYRLTKCKHEHSNTKQPLN